MASEAFSFDKVGGGGMPTASENRHSEIESGGTLHKIHLATNLS